MFYNISAIVRQLFYPYQGQDTIKSDFLPEVTLSNLEKPEGTPLNPSSLFFKSSMFLEKFLLNHSWSHNLQSVPSVILKSSCSLPFNVSILSIVSSKLS